MKTAKKIIQVFMLMLLVVVFSGCGQQKKAEVADSDDWRDAQVMIHGTRFKDVGNMTVADLEKKGFEKVICPSEVEANQNTYISVKAKDGGAALYDFSIVNKTNKSASVDKCNIEAIYISSQSSDDSFQVATDSTLINGVTVGMTSDEVANIMGTPDQEKINDEKPNTYKIWTYRTNSNEKGIQMIFEKGTDAMNMLIIRY